MQHSHGNIINSNHGNGIQPNKDFKEQRDNEQVITLPSSMGESKPDLRYTYVGTKKVKNYDCI